METLAFMTISVLVISGSAEFLKVVLSSAKVSNSILTENDFKQTINNRLIFDCQESLSKRPLTGRIIKPATVDDTDKSSGVIEFTGSLGGIQAGQDFKDSIKVIKIELRGDYTVATDTESKFVVYYKKINLGKAGARDSVNCTSATTTTPAKTTGCFHHTCQVIYSPSEKVCKGVDDCYNFSQHRITEIQDISKAEITATIKNKVCGEGKIFKGFDNSGNHVCTNLPPQPPAGLKKPSVAPCPPGHFLRATDANGNTECAPACTGGRQLIEKTVNGLVQRKCECVDQKKWVSAVRGGNYGTVRIPVNKCMSCTGEQAYWFSTYSIFINGQANSCHCRNLYKKKRHTMVGNVIAHPLGII